MRALLLLASLVLLTSCDSGSGPDDPDPETEFASLQVVYSVFVIDDAPSVGLTYTDADGETVVDQADFSQISTYTREVTLDPGTAGTFSLTATGLVNGGRMAASIVVTRLDIDLQTDSDNASVTTTGPEETSVTVSVDVEALELRTL